MNVEDIIENLRFEILKPHHEISKFQSNNENSNEYLKKDALKAQEANDRVTHLVFHEDKLIGFFSLHVFFEGIPKGDYDKIKQDIPNIPERENIPLVEIERFAIASDYEIYDIVGHIFDNIVYNIKFIFKEHGFDGVSIALSEDCELPGV